MCKQGGWDPGLARPAALFTKAESELQANGCLGGQLASTFRRAASRYIKQF